MIASTAMRHTAMFLEPGHFHAALALAVPHPGLTDEIFVYASDAAGPEDFLALIESFNGRRDRPTRWRPSLRVSPDPLGRLLAERPGDLVILAGRNDRKMTFLRRLHDAGAAG